MKTKLNAKGLLFALAAGVLLASCTKNEFSANDDASSPSVIALALTNGTDSVYVVGVCGPRDRREAIDQSALPSSVTVYVSANYTGSTFNKAFVIKDSNENIISYVVVVTFNNKPVALKFKASGEFEKVLEQREREDLHGPGHHRGGLFEDRDGQQRDTVALSSLSATIIGYLTTHLSGDTLLKAFINKDGSIVVLSKNNGLFATVFSANGSFILKAALSEKRGRCNTIEQNALPATVLSYLAATYPNYSFKKAFTVADGTSIKGYVVVIDANNTKYAVEFDANGSFVRAKTIR